MRRLQCALLATVAAVGFASIASATDMPARAPVYKAPPVVAAYNWTGFYVGGYVGGASGRDTTATDVNGWNGVPGRQWNYGMGSSIIAGGTIGYNWQPVGSSWLYGLEGEFGYIGLKGSAPDPLSPGLDTVASAKVGNWYGVFAGRLGYTWDRALLYVKGGGALVQESTSGIDACNTGACSGGLVNTTGSQTNSAWVIGGGLEYALNANWSVKGEYLYLGVHNTVRSCNAASTFCFDNNIREINTGKLGLNYRFGG